MKFFLAIAALALTVLLVKADTCFDPTIVDAEYKPLKAECKAGIKDDEADKLTKLTKCMAEKKGFLKDGTLDVEGFTAEVKRVVKADKLEAITKILTECGDDAKAEKEKDPSVNGPLLFHICYKIKIDEECSDSLQWDD